jgi:hypothetical protein
MVLTEIEKNIESDRNRSRGASQHGVEGLARGTSMMPPDLASCGRRVDKCSLAASFLSLRDGPHLYKIRDGCTL